MVLITFMFAKYSMAIFRGVLGLGLFAMVGCASVQSTAQYYVPYTTKTYPPKAPDQPMPILGKFPRDQRYVVIGRLAFESDQGWNFLRQSMVYNGQIHGADAVVLKSVSTHQQTNLYQVPPRVDYAPSTGYYRGRHGKTYTYTNWIPYYQPGYTGAYTSNITGLDSEMIILKK